MSSADTGLAVLVFLLGLGALVAGVWFMYWPAALVVGGLILMALAIGGMRGEN